MATILLSIVLVSVLFAAMAIGIMLGRQPIKGSCGGMSALSVARGGNGDCEICGGDPQKCEASGAAPIESSKTVRQFDPRRGSSE